MTDSDGDGCDDDKEVADINGDRIVSVLDPYMVARMVFWVDSSGADLNKDGALSGCALAARNSVLCPTGPVTASRPSDNCYALRAAGC